MSEPRKQEPRDTSVQPSEPVDETPLDLEQGALSPEEEAKVKGGLGTTRRNDGIWEN